MTTERTALVTGANRGIGLEVCRQLAARGLRVLLGCRDLRKGAAAARQLGGKVVAVQLDVASPKVGEAAAQLGPIDVLVNNAGVLLESTKAGTSSVFDVPLALLQETFATNVHGPLLLAQALVPGMRQRGYGRVVNVSSGMGALNDMHGRYTAYRMSKAALNAMTRILAAEAGDHVLCNAICPGWVRTDMGGERATRSVEEGARGIVWAATLADGGPTGGFFRDEKPIEW